MKRLTRFVASLALGLLAACGEAIVPAPAAAGPGAVTIDVLDVGQGDAILIRSPEGKTALVDAGPSHLVASQLRKLGVTGLDLAVVSHHHADHYGGMLEVIREFPTRVFLASGSSHTSEHYLKLLELVRDRGVRAIGPAATARRIELGSVVLTVFPQAPEDSHEENNNSVGLRLQYGGFSLLLPGDAERHERQWWEEHAPDLCAGATVLKLAHHGSRNGTDDPWLELVRPRLAVVSLGRDNEFGHPHRETLADLSRHGVPLLRTDLDGPITIRSDGRRWQVDSHPHVATGPPLSEAAARTSADRHEKLKLPDHPVDVNRATEDELRTLPGIGPVLARRIIEGRPYRSVDDLGQLEGIGEKRLAEIRPFVTVR